MNPKFFALLIFAVIIDALDYVGGAIPILGDFLDVVGVTIFAVSGMGFVSAIGLLELIPFVDFLPIHVLAVLLALKLNKFQ